MCSSKGKKNSPFSFVQNQANGKLYVDDGHTFDFTRGEYLYRQFTFSENSLESTSLNSDNNSFEPTNLIERIIIKGYSSQPSQVTEQLSRKDITFQYDSTNKILTLRKPDIPINKNFKIIIS